MAVFSSITVNSQVVFILYKVSPLGYHNIYVYGTKGHMLLLSFAFFTKSMEQELEISKPVTCTFYSKS